MLKFICLIILLYLSTQAKLKTLHRLVLINGRLHSVPVHSNSPTLSGSIVTAKGGSIITGGKTGSVLTSDCSTKGSIITTPAITTKGVVTKGIVTSPIINSCVTQKGAVVTTSKCGTTPTTALIGGSCATKGAVIATKGTVVTKGIDTTCDKASLVGGGVVTKGLK
jgi:hypothetical protein